MDYVASSSIPKQLAKFCVRKAKYIFLDKDGKIEKFMMLYAGMQALLKQADSMKPKDERVKFWIQVVRDLAEESKQAFDKYGRITQRCSKGGLIITRKVIIFYAKLKLCNKYMEIYEKHKHAQEVLKSLGFEYLGDESSVRRICKQLFIIGCIAAAGVGVGAGIGTGAGMGVFLISLFNRDHPKNT